MDCITPGFSILHYLLECAQTHVHWVGDAVWPSHPFFTSSIFPSIGAFPMNWLFTSGGQSIRPSASASALPVNTQGWFPLGLTVGCEEWKPLCPTLKAFGLLCLELSCLVLFTCFAFLSNSSAFSLCFSACHFICLHVCCISCCYSWRSVRAEWFWSGHILGNSSTWDNGCNWLVSIQAAI